MTTHTSISSLTPGPKSDNLSQGMQCRGCLILSTGRVEKQTRPSRSIWACITVRTSLPTCTTAGINHWQAAGLASIDFCDISYVMETGDQAHSIPGSDRVETKGIDFDACRSANMRSSRAGCHEPTSFPIRAGLRSRMDIDLDDAHQLPHL